MTAIEFLKHRLSAPELGDEYRDTGQSKRAELVRLIVRRVFFLGIGGRKNNPPRAIDLAERASDQQRGKILQANGMESQHCEHEAVTELARPAEGRLILPRLRLDHQRHARVNENVVVDQTVKFRSRPPASPE
jgi:hypothetical protein